MSLLVVTAYNWLDSCQEFQRKGVEYTAFWAACSSASSELSRSSCISQLTEGNSLVLEEGQCQDGTWRGQRSIRMELTCLKRTKKEYLAQSRQVLRSEFRNKVGLSTFACMTGSTRQLLFSVQLFWLGEGLGKEWQLKAWILPDYSRRIWNRVDLGLPGAGAVDTQNKPPQ